METQADCWERIAKKIAAAKWPDNVAVPKKAQLKLRGIDGNAFSVLAAAIRAAEKANWSESGGVRSPAWCVLRVFRREVKGLYVHNRLRSPGGIHRSRIIRGRLRADSSRNP
jgi:hypothetical protein